MWCHGGALGGVTDVGADPRQPGATVRHFLFLNCHFFFFLCGLSCPLVAIWNKCCSLGRPRNIRSRSPKQRFSFSAPSWGGAVLGCGAASLASTLSMLGAKLLPKVETTKTVTRSCQKYPAGGSMSAPCRDPGFGVSWLLPAWAGGDSVDVQGIFHHPLVVLLGRIL